MEFAHDRGAVAGVYPWGVEEIIARHSRLDAGTALVGILTAWCAMGRRRLREPSAGAVWIRVWVSCRSRNPDYRYTHGVADSRFEKRGRSFVVPALRETYFVVVINRGSGGQASRMKDCASRKHQRHDRAKPGEVTEKVRYPANYERGNDEAATGQRSDGDRAGNAAGYADIPAVLTL